MVGVPRRRCRPVAWRYRCRAFAWGTIAAGCPASLNGATLTQFSRSTTRQCSVAGQPRRAHRAHCAARPRPPPRSDVEPAAHAPDEAMGTSRAHGLNCSVFGAPLQSELRLRDVREGQLSARNRPAGTPDRGAERTGSQGISASLQDQDREREARRERLRARLTIALLLLPFH